VPETPPVADVVATVVLIVPVGVYVCESIVTVLNDVPVFAFALLYVIVIVP